jgi:poly(3-hydroxybutyrate) depolymerase
VDPSKIKRVALLTIEGEHDDITGLGQTRTAHDLCVNIPEHRRAHWMQPGVGHFGVFNGSRFRAEVLPRVQAFIRAHDE